MLNDGRPFLQTAPQMMLYPGAAIFMVVLGFNLLGDGLRDVLDPKCRPGFSFSGIDLGGSHRRHFGSRKS